MEEFIISIGPQTDFLFDRFRLSDTLIPNLRDLAQTVRSSNWEAELASSPAWGLSRIQAAKLSNALLADIQANPVANRRKVSFCIQFLGVLELIYYFQAPSAFLEKPILFCHWFLHGLPRPCLFLVVIPLLTL